MPRTQDHDDTDTDVERPVYRKPNARKGKRDWTLWIVIGSVLGAVLLAVVIGLTVRKVTGADNRQGAYVVAKSKWWSKKATPEKVQAIINELGTKGGSSVIFNQDGDYTVSRNYTGREIRNHFIPKSEFVTLKEECSNIPEGFSNPKFFSDMEIKVKYIRKDYSGRSLDSIAESMLDDLARGYSLTDGNWGEKEYNQFMNDLDNSKKR